MLWERRNSGMVEVVAMLGVLTLLGLYQDVFVLNQA